MCSAFSALAERLGFLSVAVVIAGWRRSRFSSETSQAERRSSSDHGSIWDSWSADWSYAKNTLGGYVGFRRFVSYGFVTDQGFSEGTKAAYVDADNHKQAFELIWKGHCTGDKEADAFD